MGNGHEENYTKEFVKLISMENHEFILEKRVACHSKTIKTMFDGNFSEAKKGEARFPEISTPILEKVIQYLHYRDKYTNSIEPIPEFHIEPDIVTDLMIASNFLEC